MSILNLPAPIALGDIPQGGRNRVIQWRLPESSAYLRIDLPPHPVADTPVTFKILNDDDSPMYGQITIKVNNCLIFTDDDGRGTIEYHDFYRDTKNGTDCHISIGGVEWPMEGA